MERYANRGGDSGVVAYKIGVGYIVVQFRDNSVYTYTSASAGAHNIASMHRHARGGHGLNAFINTHVRNKYASKRQAGWSLPSPPLHTDGASRRRCAVSPQGAWSWA